MLPMTVAESSDDNAMSISGFVDFVMFSHNGENRPESMTTRMFRPVWWRHRGEVCHRRLHLDKIEEF